MLSLAEVAKDAKRLTKRDNAPQRQPWLVCGLHKDDGGVYQQYNVAEYLAGYAGPPPMVHLRRGERLRRYLEPGLEDGKTFVFWGRNYRAGGIPGPERSLTWVNQPEQMYQSKTGTKHKTGQARYANAVYIYEPNFVNRDYREAMLETPEAVTYEFQTPYIIAATPADDSDWGIYNPGCKNGLIVEGKPSTPLLITISLDRGKSWQKAGELDGRLDLTDFVKGYRQYWLRIVAPVGFMSNCGLKITTVCQMNSSLVPRLKDDGTTITYEATGQALVSAGPTIAQAKSALVGGTMDSPRVTLGLITPRLQKPTAIFAAGHIASSTPPDPKVTYQIEYSTDGGKKWLPLVKDWHINRQGEEPKDFWSQSLCWGSTKVSSSTVERIQVRWKNDGGKKYLRTEMHLAYQAGNAPTKWTFAWSDDSGPHVEQATLSNSNPTHKLKTGKNVRTKWVEVTPTP